MTRTLLQTYGLKVVPRCVRLDGRDAAPRASA